MASLKPQDIITLLKVHIWSDRHWTYGELSTNLAMSASEVHAGLKRSEVSHLYNSVTRCVSRPALLEFLIHGLKYVFPSQPGPLVLGLPTAHSAEPLKSLLVSDPSEAYVWPYPSGTVRGQAIEPLYRCVPQAVQQDQKLYTLLCLIDAIRVGRVREQLIAIEYLTEMIQNNEFNLS